MRRSAVTIFGFIVLSSNAMAESEREQVKESDLRTSISSPNFHSPAQSHQWKGNHFDWQLGVREQSEVLPTDEIGLKSRSDTKSRFTRFGFLTRYPSRAAGRLGLVADVEKGEGTWSVVDRNAQVVDEATGEQERSEAAIRPMLAFTFGKRLTVGTAYEIARRQEDDGYVRFVSDVNILTGAIALHGESWEFGATYGEQLRGSAKSSEPGTSVTLFNGIDAAVAWSERQGHAAWHVTDEWTWSLLWQRRTNLHGEFLVPQMADKKSLTLEFQGDVAVMSFVGAMGDNYIGTRFADDFATGSFKSIGGSLRWMSEFGSEFGFQYLQRLVEPNEPQSEVVRHFAREISLSGNIKM